MTAAPARKLFRNPPPRLPAAAGAGYHRVLSRVRFLEEFAETMPLPVAHGLLGASLVAAVLPSTTPRRYALALAAGAVLANAADLDFGLVFALHSRAWHRGFTHSLAFALVVGLALFFTLGRRRASKAAAYALAYASHAVLDFATTKFGGGVQLLWPFSAERLALGWRGLSELPSRLPPAEILGALCIEFALFAPPLAILLLLRWRAAARAAERAGRGA